MSFGAQACRQGETVEARWVDGTFKVATILEVRDGPSGICGHYRVSWYHTRVCEDTNHEYYGDTESYSGFCVVSRDALRKCKEELCKNVDSAAEAKKNSSKKETSDDDSGEDMMIYIALGAMVLSACCVLARLCLHACCLPFQEIDEEKSSVDATSPSKKSGELWTISPTSVASSPIAKWLDTTRKAVRQPSKKVAPHNEPVAPAVVKVFAQPQRNSSPQHLVRGPEELSKGPAEVVAAHEIGLRQAARAYGMPPQEWRQSRSNYLESKSLKRPPPLEMI